VRSPSNVVLRTAFASAAGTRGKGDVDRAAPVGYPVALCHATGQHVRRSAGFFICGGGQKNLSAIHLNPTGTQGGRHHG